MEAKTNFNKYSNNSKSQDKFQIRIKIKINNNRKNKVKRMEILIKMGLAKRNLH